MKLTLRGGFLRLAATLAVFIFAGGTASAQLLPQVQLPGNKIPQFVDALPTLDVAGGLNPTMQTVVAGPGVFDGTPAGGELVLNMQEFQANIMPSTGWAPANGLPYTGTWTFGYRIDTPYPAGPAETPVNPVIVAARGTPLQVRYVNNLTANGIHWRDWTDQTLHSAYHMVYGEQMPTLGNNPLCGPAVQPPLPWCGHYLGPIPAVPHLHGAEDPAAIDGGPEAFFLSDKCAQDVGTATGTACSLAGVVSWQGAAYYSMVDAATGALPPSNEAIYRYPNTQEAAPLWFHDHLLGGTRVNATFAGLAGAYALIDPDLALPPGLHPVGLQNVDAAGQPSGPVRFLVPLVIQDRMFDTNGQLFFPNLGVNPEHPFWVPEFVGDTITVNGKVWPYLNVDRQRYRFYVIDGSNSRPYDMFLQDPVTGVKGPKLWVIANDGGYLDAPVAIDPNATGRQTKAGVSKSLLMMPGERYEIIVDFNDPAWIAAETAAYRARGLPATINLTLRNLAPTVDGNPKAATEGRIMQFRVSSLAPVDTSYDPAGGAPLRAPIFRLAGVTPTLTRALTLNEVPGPGGPLEALVNNSKWNGMRAAGGPVNGGVFVNGNFVTEQPAEGTTEIWEIVNTTADAHPIHLHGVQFQILNRELFDMALFFAAYSAAFPGDGTVACPAGVFCPGYGPPLAYAPSAASGGKHGGNPDVTPFLLPPAQPPGAYESGWKDTAIMPSGMVTRIAVRFAPQDGSGAFPYDPNSLATNGLPSYYVWHCHITDHEDNEMMRPMQFVSLPLPNCTAGGPTPCRSFVQGVDY